ncbi:NUDIX hydrolase [Panacibacter ginsenosidivorans]|uniref:GDP-mannose pyrophosphatase n=1 Tax=Panacibacter ginsenosidivorans TaxID=1813871 RepID=A0A5B8V5Z9_9BACT|nr:NUDIX hydrolase [Panacibacter ginsenosidivorans]QEC66181.1 NUDIX hydrolase [Panacibacter ginsenosidivorans]
MNEQHNPWQIIDQHDAYDNNWITLTHYNVINPSGGKGIYGKVHFKNTAIGVVPLDRHLNTYLVGQYRFPINRYSWEIPEGGGPLNEDPLDAAKRELMEETGLKAKHWIKILDMYLSNSVSDEGCAIYVATDLSQHTATPEETEQLAIKKVPFDEVYQMVQDGKITDAVTVAAILKTKLMLLDGSLHL